MTRRTIFENRQKECMTKCNAWSANETKKVKLKLRSNSKRKDVSKRKGKVSYGTKNDSKKE